MKFTQLGKKVGGFISPKKRRWQCPGCRTVYPALCLDCVRAENARRRHDFFVMAPFRFLDNTIKRILLSALAVLVLIVILLVLLPRLQ